MSQNDEEIKSGEEEMEKQSNQNIEIEKENLNENNINTENNENNINNESNQNVNLSQNNIQPENNYDYEKNKKEIMEKIEIRKFQADAVEKYINETGIGTAFQIIFSELLSKNIQTDQYYEYTASRLRQFGSEKTSLSRKNEKNEKNKNK